MQPLPPELLRRIFEDCGQIDQITCTRVCKDWSEVALDVVWYEVESLGRVANILSPVKKKKENKKISYTFERLPGPKSWLRFESKYSARVHVFRRNYHGHSDWSNIIKAISFIRSPTSPIFPNLRSFKWSVYESDGFLEPIMFLHDGIKECTFHNAIFPPNLGLVPLLEALKYRVASITSLTLDVSPKPDMIETLIDLLGTLSLEHLVLPGFADISSILYCLGAHTKLRALSLGRLQSPVAVTGNKIPHFPCLERFKAYVKNDSTLLSFFGGRNFCQLRHIEISISSVEDHRSVKKLLQAFSQCCPAVTELDVTCVGKEPGETLLEFGDMQDILKCNRIMQFKLTSPYHLDLSDSDVEAMALAWPRLRSINLFPEFQCLAVRQRRSRELGLYAIFLLARLCPNLTRVVLPLNAKVSDTPPFRYSSTSQSQMTGNEVAQLNEFDLGSCRVEDGDEHILPELLGQVCAPDCLVFNRWREIAGDEGWDDEAKNKMGVKWAFIKGVFPRFSELYSRLRALENKNKSLQNHMKALGMKAN